MDSYNSLAKLYDKFSFDAEAKDWAGYISALLKKGGTNKGGRVLDIGCGTGKITLQLYCGGFDMIALDNSAHMLEMAARRFATAGARIQVINQDMRKINLHGKVDAVVCVNDGINYILESEEVLRTFTGIHSVLEEGGVLLFDVSSKHKLKSMHGQSYFEENDDGLYIWRNEYDEKSDIITMDLSLYSHLKNDLYEKNIETHRQRAYEVSVLTAMLEESGFADIKAYDCFSYDAPKIDSNRIQFSAVGKIV